MPRIAQVTIADSRAKPASRARPIRRSAAGAALFAFALLVGTPASGQISVGSSPGGNSGFTWGVGVGGNCRDVVEKMRRNWTDVRSIVEPDSKAMRPRSRDFYCVSPQYTREAMPKTVSGFSGLKCYDFEGKGFCCDAQLRQCATK